MASTPCRILCSFSAQELAPLNPVKSCLTDLCNEVTDRALCALSKAGRGGKLLSLTLESYASCWSVSVVWGLRWEGMRWDTVDLTRCVPLPFDVYST